MLCLALGPSAVLVTGFGVFIHPVADAFHWSVGQVSFAVSLIALSLTFIAPLQGLLLDRFGARRLVLYSIPCLGGGLIAMRWLPNSLFVFYAAWVMLPAAAIGIWPTSYLKTVSGWFDRQLGRAVGTANAGIGIGAIFIPPIASALIATWGWRNAFAGLGAMALLALPIAALFLRENSESIISVPLSSGGTRLTSSSASTVKQLLRNVDFRILAIGYLAIGITGTGTVANLIPLLLDSGMTLRMAVATTSAYGVAALSGRFLAGFLLDRYSFILVLNGFVAAAALATAGFAVGIHGNTAVFAAVLIGLIMGAEFDVLSYAVRQYFGMKIFGKVYGLIFGLFQLGASVGAATIAICIHRTGNYHLAMWVFFGALVIGFLVLSTARALPRR